MKKTILALCAFALVGCANQGSHPPQSSTVVHYQCGTLPLTVTSNSTKQQVSFLFDGQQLQLNQVVAASGAKYSDSRYTFWSKGRTAFVERDGAVIVDDCIEL
ncbi:MliC family protein [Rouxiella sp. Mn2063]|uniref:MliC family protein n=1 Tax=Rouxiella sp. Mn2063 TaxID=3395262 RepID=UPI003BDF81C4